MSLIELQFQQFKESVSIWTPEARERKVKELRDTFISEIQRDLNNQVLLNRAKEFIQIVRRYKEKQQSIINETTPEWITLKQLIGEQQLRSGSILSSLNRPYTVGATKTIGDWIEKDVNFSFLKSSIINLLNNQDRLMQVYNQISNYIPQRSTKATIKIDGKVINSVIKTLRDAEINIPNS